MLVSQGFQGRLFPNFMAMFLRESRKARRLSHRAELATAAEEISAGDLETLVREIAVPRSFQFERGVNRRIAEWIHDRLESYGLRTGFQGRYRNVVALTEAARERPAVLVGAHYDSVPRTPGADDNASAVAALLACARIVGRYFSDLPVGFVAFNCEEIGFRGSAEFARYCARGGLEVETVHVLEMLGYRDHRPGSQSKPPLLPVRLPSVGDFLGLVGNWRSRHPVERVLRTARTYLPHLPVLGLKVYFGLEALYPVLQRSDHASFWRRGIPALMWTDTSEYRNPNYHLQSDIPETLDYDFLEQVTRLLLLSLLD